MLQSASTSDPNRPSGDTVAAPVVAVPVLHYSRFTPTVPPAQNPPSSVGWGSLFIVFWLNFFSFQSYTRCSLLSWFYSPRHCIYDRSVTYSTVHWTTWCNSKYPKTIHQFIGSIACQSISSSGRIESHSTSDSPKLCEFSLVKFVILNHYFDF